MEHGFPPGANWVPIRTESLIAHVVMSLLMLGVVGCMYLTRRRLASAADIWGWAAVIVATPFIAMIVWPGRSYYSQSSPGFFVLGYVLLAWLICLAGMIRGHISISRHQKSSALRYSIACLSALGTVVFLCQLPSPGHPREASRRSTCKSNLRNLGFALWNYYDVHKRVPELTSGTPPVSWRVNVSQFVDFNSISREYDRSQTWDSTTNEPLAQRFHHAYMCPSRSGPETDVKRRVYTDYTMLAGRGTLSAVKPRGPKGIADGASNTLAIVEATGLNIIWTEPRDASVDREPLGINFKGTGKNDSPGIMSSWHVGGAQAVFADGSVRFLSQDIDPQVFKALTTANGGESVEDWDSSQ
jgi:prepilin-type processing-associated H-X9-DG protein